MWHQCGYCAKGTNGYFYCATIVPFPDGNATHALCNPTLKRQCFGKHVAGHIPVHKIHIGIKKSRSSPRLADRAQRAAAAARAAARPTPSAKRRLP